MSLARMMFYLNFNERPEAAGLLSHNDSADFPLHKIAVMTPPEQ